MRAIHPPQRQRRCCGGRVVKRSRRPEEIGGSLTDIDDKMTDFLVTACLVKHLDLLMSVDTGPAHLAGALHWPSPCGRCCRLCPTGAGCANARTRRGTRQCAFSGKNPAATGKAYSRMWGVCWPGLPPHLRAHSEIFCYSPQAYDLQAPENSGAASAMAVLRAVARPRRYRHETFSKRYNSRDSGRLDFRWTFAGWKGRRDPALVRKHLRHIAAGGHPALKGQGHGLGAV